MELDPVAASSLESQDGTHASLKSPAFKTAPGRIWQTSSSSNINDNRKDSMDFVHFAESLSSYSGTRFGVDNVVHAILILIGHYKQV